MFMPFNILGIWLRALVAVVMLSGGVFWLAEWFRNRERPVITSVEPASTPNLANEGRLDRELDELNNEYGTVRWRFGLNRETAYLITGLMLLGWCCGGGCLLSPRLLRRAGDDPHAIKEKGNTQPILLPDGSKLMTRVFGPIEGEPIVMTHGWGLDGNEWCYSKEELGNSYRLILWDLPGLGGSDRPKDRDWSLERLARNLDRVIQTTGAKPVTLVGHSIGVMIVLKTLSNQLPARMALRQRTSRV